MKYKTSLTYLQQKFSKLKHKKQNRFLALFNHYAILGIQKSWNASVSIAKLICQESLENPRLQMQRILSKESVYANRCLIQVFLHTEITCVQFTLNKAERA